VEAVWRRYAERVRAVRDLFPHVQLVVVPELMLVAEGLLPTPRGDRIDLPAYGGGGFRRPAWAPEA
jgi:formamidase